MDLDEALAELGLDPAGDHDQGSVRRAYLKGVKLRKPETDPEGFRRLREAFDLLRGMRPVVPHVHVSTPLSLPLSQPQPQPLPALADPFSAAADHLAQDQPELAVNVIAAALPSESNLDGGLYLQQALRFMLFLHKRGLVKPASRLFAAIKASLGGKGPPQAGASSPQLALLYLVCTELDAMPDLPITFRQGVALVVLDADPDASNNTVGKHKRAHGSLSTLHWRKLLRRRAPTLASLFHWYYQPPLDWGVVLPSAAIAAGILIVIAVFGWISGLPPAISPDPISIPIPDGMSLLVFCEGDSARGTEPQRQQVRREPLCTWVQLLDEALREGKCPQARGFLEGLQRGARDYVPRVRAEVEKLAARVEQRCRPGALAPPV